MTRSLRTVIGVFVLSAIAIGTADARRTGVASLVSSKCALPVEISAIQTASVQQELMVAALTCNQIASFNAFQTNFGPELRTSDKALMRMFMRLYGSAPGQAEYHAFKTRLANNSEMRSIRGNRDFCDAAGLVFSAALTPMKPALAQFVANVQVLDASPVDSCQLRVADGLQGAAAGAASQPAKTDSSAPPATVSAAATAGSAVPQ